MGKEDQWPSNPPHENDDNWEQGERVRFVCENQLLCNIVNGYATNTQEALQGTFDYVHNSVEELLEKGLLPATDTSDAMEWRDRGFTKQSDRCCNLALDNGDFGYQYDRWQELMSYSPSWEIQSDGACRGDGRSSIGYTITAILRIPFSPIRSNQFSQTNQSQANNLRASSDHSSFQSDLSGGGKRSGPGIPPVPAAKEEKHRWKNMKQRTLPLIGLA